MRSGLHRRGLGSRTHGQYRRAVVLAGFLALTGSATGAQAQQEDIIRAVAVDDGPPWARGVPLEIRKQAHGLFLEGNALIEDGLFGKAAARYERALALWDHPAFHYNLGIARMNLDQIIEAHERFREARRHGSQPIGQDRYKQAQVYLNLLGNQLATVEVVCDEPGAAIALDGKPLFIGPGRQRVKVRPGGHRVEASKDGRMPDVQQAVLDPGGSARVTLAPQLPEHLVTTRRWPVWVPLAVAGAGALAVAGANLMDHHSSTLFDGFDGAFDRRCPGPDGCLDSEVPRGLHAQLGRARAWQWAARVTYVAGGLAVVSGAALLYLNRERLVRVRGAEAPASMSVEPMLAPRGAGVSAHLRF